MTDVERIEQRLSAVERTVTGEIDIDAEALQEVLTLAGDVDALEERIGGLEDRLAKLEADVQSIGGYYSEVESVNEDVERHALSAVAAVDRLEDRVDDLEESVHRLDPDEKDGQRTVEQAVSDVEHADTADVDKGDGVDRNGTESDASAGNGNGRNGDDPATAEDDGSFPGGFRAIALDGSDDRADEAAAASDTVDSTSGNDTDGGTSGRTPTQQRVDELVSAGERSEEAEESESVFQRLRQRLP